MFATLKRGWAQIESELNSSVGTGASPARTAQQHEDEPRSQHPEVHEVAKQHQADGSRLNGGTHDTDGEWSSVRPPSRARAERPAGDHRNGSSRPVTPASSHDGQSVAFPPDGAAQSPQRPAPHVDAASSQPATPRGSAMGSELSSSSEPGAKKFEPDSASREELVVAFKKQAVVLVKTRAKCEELLKAYKRLQETPKEAPGAGVASEEVAALRAAHERSEGEVASLRAKCEEFEVDRTKLLRRAEDAEARLQETEASLAKALAASESASSARAADADARAEEQRRAWAETEKGLTERLGKLEKVAAALKERLVKSENERKSLDAALQDARAAADERTAQLERAAREAEGRLLESAHAVDELSSRVRALEADKASLVEDVGRLTAAATATTTNDGEQLHAVVAERDALRADAVASVARIDALESALASARKGEDAHAALEGARAQLAALGSELALQRDAHAADESRYQSLSDKLSAELHRVNTELFAAQREKESLLARLHSAETEAVASDAAARDAESRAEALADEIEGLRGGAQNTVTDAALTESLRAQVRELSDALAQAQEDCSEAVARAERAKRSAEDVRLAKEALAADVARIEVECTAAFNREESEKARADDAGAECARLVEERDSLLRRAHEMESELARVSARCDALERRTAELDGREAEAQSREEAAASAMSEALSSSRKEAEELRGALERASAELSVRTAALERLQGELSDVVARLGVAKDECGSARARAAASEQAVEVLRGELASARRSADESAAAAERLKADVARASTEGIAGARLMSLELDDYRRTIEDLNGRIAALEAAGAETADRLASSGKECALLREGLEERGAKLAAAEAKLQKFAGLLQKAKADIAETRKAAAERESVAKEAADREEQLQQCIEDLKLAAADSAAAVRAAEMRAESAVAQAAADCAALQEELMAAVSRAAEAETRLAATEREFSAYKIRVHTVLKKKKDDREGSDDAHETQLTALRLELSAATARHAAELERANTLESELAVLRPQVAAAVAECDALRAELRAAVDLAEENAARLAQESERGGASAVDAAKRAAREQEEETARLRESHASEVHMLRALLRDEEARASGLSAQLEDARREAAVLRGEVGALRDRLRDEASVARAHRGQPVGTRAEDAGEGPGPSRTQADGGAAEGKAAQVDLSRLLSFVSETGEGTRTPSGDPESAASAAELARLRGEVEQLRVERDAVVGENKQLLDLVRDADAEAQRMEAQAHMLKEEIRRLERNAARESVVNLEYIKNVVLKYAEHPSERASLVPVLATVLHFSPQEMARARDASVEQSWIPAPSSVTSAWNSVKGLW